MACRSFVTAAAAARTYSANAGGQPAQRAEIDVLCFFSMIILYLRDALRALRPCHGRRPLRKYTSTWCGEVG